MIQMGEEQREEGLQRREEGLRERRANRGLGGLDLGQPCCQGSCGFDPLGMRPSPTFDEESGRHGDMVPKKTRFHQQGAS